MKNQKFTKNKVDSLKKLSTRACLFPLANLITKVIIALAPIREKKEKRIITVAKVGTYKTTAGGPLLYSSLYDLF